MARKDNLIREGLKIAQNWTDESADFQSFFINLKKENVSWEKRALKNIESRVDTGEDPRVLVQELRTCQEYLADHRERAEREYKRHYDWVRKTPREGAAGICKDLKLKKDDPDYEAVVDGLKKALIANTKQFSSTESSWTKDLLPQLKLLKGKMNTLTKIVSGDVSKSQAYLQQFQKSKASFAKMVRTTVVELKIDAAQGDLKRVQEPNFLQGNPKALQIMLQSYQVKESKVDKIAALIDKNYKRILKSLPDTFKRNSWVYRNFNISELTNERDEAMRTLAFAKQSYQQFLREFERHFPEVYRA